jgi:hypothetical protein
MHAHESDRAQVAHTPQHQPPSPEHPAPGLFALQTALGNATVVQLLRQCGHPGALETPQQVQRSAVGEVLRGGGRPLDDATRDEMERRLGADFSDVRVHVGSAAQASAAELGALAYTAGSHVVIGDGGADKHVLAHELTHVIQQRRGPVSGSDTGQGFALSDPGDHFERAAEANAHRVMSGPVPDARPESGPHGTAGAGTVQRASSTTLENAVVTHYQPSKAGTQLGTDLTIRRPRTVTGPIQPTGTSGRAAAPNPIAVNELQKAYKAKMGRGPTEPQVWKDLFGGAGYDRGHVMGLEVGGSDVKENIVPQWSLNQGTGMWRRIEQALVNVNTGTVRFEVTYAESRGNHRRVMIPIKIDIYLNNASYNSWENEPDVNDLIRAGRDPSDLAENYKYAKEAQDGQTSLTEAEMQQFALRALSHDKATSLSYQDYENKVAQGQAPGTSTADTHMQDMTLSTFPKDRRDKLIKSYVDAGWVTKSGTGDNATYTLHDPPAPAPDSDTSSGSESDIDMSDGSQQSSPGQPFATIQFSQGSSDSEYEDQMATDSQ